MRWIVSHSQRLQHYKQYDLDISLGIGREKVLMTEARVSPHPHFLRDPDRKAEKQGAEFERQVESIDVVRQQEFI